MSYFLKKIYFSIFESNKFSEKFRYLFVGGSCAVADLFTLFILVNIFHIWYLTASIISFIVLGIAGYAGQKYFTFRDYSKRHGIQLTIFFLIIGTGLLLNSLSMLFFVSFLGFWYLWGSVITKFIMLVWNFTANKYLTFNSKFHGNAE